MSTPFLDTSLMHTQHAAITQVVQRRDTGMRMKGGAGYLASIDVSHDTNVAVPLQGDDTLCMETNT